MKYVSGLLSVLLLLVLTHSAFAVVEGHIVSTGEVCNQSGGIQVPAGNYTAPNFKNVGSITGECEYAEFWESSVSDKCDSWDVRLYIKVEIKYPGENYFTQLGKTLKDWEFNMSDTNDQAYLWGTSATNYIEYNESIPGTKVADIRFTMYVEDESDCTQQVGTVVEKAWVIPITIEDSSGQ